MLIHKHGEFVLIDSEMYFTTIEVKPPIIALIEKEGAEIKPHQSTYEPGFVDVAINAAALKLLPLFYGIERNGCWELLSGNNYFSALSDFINDKVAYSENGSMPKFRGLKFSELPRLYKNKIRTAEFKIVLLSSFSGNRGKESSFTENVKSIVNMPLD